LQRVRIVRDIGGDARHGRIYIPVDTLQRFEVPAAGHPAVAPFAASSR
jgi:phytoene synthase